jgi:predicted RNA-binding protein
MLPEPGDKGKTAVAVEPDLEPTPHPRKREAIMANSATLEEIERRIQIVEDNLRELVEQAAAYSGAADEERNADRIAEQQAKLDALRQERAALLGED